MKEIDSLSTLDGYIYSFTTHSVSQVGLILILNIYIYYSIPNSSIMPNPINMCTASWNLCDDLLNKVGCPYEDRVNIGCSENNNYQKYQGLCSCGHFTTDRINLLLVDSQVKGNITNSMVTVWPRNPNGIIHPTEVYDFCLTYDNVCNHFLNRINCPINLRKTNGCDKRYLYFYSYSSTFSFFSYNHFLSIFYLSFYYLEVFQILLEYVNVVKLKLQVVELKMSWLMFLYLVDMIYYNILVILP